MRTCWVLDHPAHVRLLAPFIRSGQSNDLIIATDRVEVRNLLENSDGIISRRQTLWVTRPVGKWKRLKALSRINKGFNFMSKAGKDGSGKVRRIVSVGAPLELLAYRTVTRLTYINELDWRIYITDTEVNHLAHKLALRGCTDVVLPTHWDESLDGGFLKKVQNSGVKGKTRFTAMKLHRLDGLHGHVHLAPSRRPIEVSSPPRVLVRRLAGGGIHDAGEIIEIPESVWDGLLPTLADEGKYAGDAWDLTKQLAAHDCVITNSVTLASEACLLGTPTLLISKAQRGFLTRLQEDGHPLFIWQENCEGEKFAQILTQFLCGIHLTDALEPEQWPNAKQQLADILNIELIG